MGQYINHQARVCYFISPIKQWKMEYVKGIIPTYHINKLNHFQYLSQILRIKLIMENILSR